MPSDGQLTSKNLSGNHSIVVPPDPIPNSEVKRNRADGSVGSPHVRVGHFQTPNTTKPVANATGFFHFSLELTTRTWGNKKSERSEAQTHVEVDKCSRQYRHFRHPWRS